MELTTLEGEMDMEHTAENDAAAVLRDVLDALDRIERFDVPQGGDYGVASADAVVAIRNVIPPETTRGEGQ